jgi:hypothetical protein
MRTLLMAALCLLALVPGAGAHVLAFAPEGARYVGDSGDSAGSWKPAGQALQKRDSFSAILPAGDRRRTASGALSADRPCMATVGDKMRMGDATSGKMLRVLR